MTRFQSSFNAQGEAAQARRAAMLARIDAWRALEQRAADASAKAKPQFDKRGQLLPRERVALLLDPGAPWLPLCSLAGFMQDTKDPAKSVPGGGMIAGPWLTSGVSMNGGTCARVSMPTTSSMIERANLLLSFVAQLAAPDSAVPRRPLRVIFASSRSAKGCTPSITNSRWWRCAALRSRSSRACWPCS